MAAAAPKSFSLAGRVLKLDTAADLDAHIAPLVEMDDVEEVKLLGNTLGIGACQRLGEVLSGKKSLKSADFSDMFTGRLLSEIPVALSALLASVTNLPNLTTVNLNDNAFGLNTVAPLVAFLSAHVPLQHLYLNNNGLGPDAGARVADALSELHAKKVEAREAGQTVPDLETVVCGRNRLENGSMRAWARTLSLHNKIKTIKMVQNGIRPEGMSHFLENGVAHATSLETLDLQDNTFTLVGARQLARVVPELAELRELGISDTLVGARGGNVLFKALGRGKNGRLETLRLQFADLTPTALKELLAVGTNHLPALRRIDLNGNKFSEVDPSLVGLRELLDERRDRSAGDDADEEDWGLDSLSDLDDEDDEDDEDEEEEEDDDDEDFKKEDDEADVEKRADKLIRDAIEAQEEPVLVEKDDVVDALAKDLSKVEL